MTRGRVRVSAQLAMAELMHSGCTTSSDHLYIFPNTAGSTTPSRPRASIGMRFHASRGRDERRREPGRPAAGQLRGGRGRDPRGRRAADRRLPRPTPGIRWCRIVLAPCSPFSVTPDLMRDAAALARDMAGRPAHPSRRELSRRPTATQFGCGPASMPRSSAGSATTSGSPTASVDERRDRPLRRDAAPAWRIARAPTCRLGSGIARCGEMRDAGREGRARRRRLGLQRRVPHVHRGAAGDAAAACRERRRRDERPRGAGDRHARRRPGARPRRRIGALEPGRRADLAIWDMAESGRRGPGIRWRRFCFAGRSRCGIPSSKGAGWCARGGWRGSRSRPCSRLRAAGWRGWRARAGRQGGAPAGVRRAQA